MEIVAGLFAVAVLAIRLISEGGSFSVDLEAGSLLLLGLLALISGFGLLRSKPLAWHGAVLFQILMIPVFSLGPAVYRPGVGLFIPMGINLGAVNTTSSINEFTLGVDFTVAARSTEMPQYLAFNLVALVCLVVLLRYRRARQR